MIKVAQKLRQLREEKGLSQRELARLSGVSNGTISLIEQSRTDPTLGLMMKILEAMNVSVADFFSAPQSDPDQIFFSKADMVDLGRGHVSYLQPGESTGNRQIQLLWERYEPGASTGNAPLVHDGEECGFVLKGRIEIRVGEQIRILGPGEAYYFKSTTPHRFRSIGDEPVEVISACTPPF